MSRCALFVDAGYALADGAMAVHGTRRQDSVAWDHAGLIKLLTGVARDRTGLPVLRCYWYESAVDGQRTPEQEALGETPGVKLRLASTRPGRREGVEVLLRRDLITLAKNKAITEAVIASADEGLAEVVAEAQEFGLRVLIVHIASENGWTVPQSLRQEADDIAEISAVHLRPFVELIRDAETARSQDRPGGQGQATGRHGQHSAAGAPGSGQASGAGYPGAGDYLLPLTDSAQAAGGQRAIAGPVAGQAAAVPGQDLVLRNGAAHNGAGHNGTGHNGTGQNGASQNGAIQYGAGHNGAGYNGAGHNGGGQNGASQNGPDSNGSGVGAPGFGASGYGAPAFGGNGAGQYGMGLPQQGLAGNGSGAPSGNGNYGQPQNGGYPNGQAQSAGSNGSGANGAGPNGTGQVGPLYNSSGQVGQAQNGYAAGANGGAAPNGNGNANGNGKASWQIGATQADLVAYGYPGSGQHDSGRGSSGRGGAGQNGAGQNGNGQNGNGQNGNGQRYPDSGASAADQRQYQGYQPGPAGGGHQQAPTAQPQHAYSDPGSYYQPGPQQSPAPGQLSGPDFGGGSGSGSGGGPFQTGAYFGQAQPAELPGPAQYQSGQYGLAVPPQHDPAGFAGTGQFAPNGAGLALPQPERMSQAPVSRVQQAPMPLPEAVKAAHAEGYGFGESVGRDAPALWLDAVLARKPRMPSDLEARLLQGSALPIDSLLHDEVRHSLRRGFWDALETARQ